MTNREVRAWYQKRVASIAGLNLEWAAAGIGLEERAYWAWQIRHEARLEARSLMENPDEVADLQERDLRLYGNPEGPTFDQLVEENRQRGLVGDQVYERIISGSQTTSRTVDERFEVE